MGQGRMTSKTVSVGKYRALQRTSTAEGIFTILALDHQDSLRRAMNPSAPLSVTFDHLEKFKSQVIRSLAIETSGVLLDPVLGAAQAIQGNYLGTAGLLVELEKADYQLRPMPQNVEVLGSWSVEKIKRMGSDGVKLFFYYNPDLDALTTAQDEFIERVVSECGRYDIPLFAEPILLPTDDTAGFARNFTRQLIETAQRIEKLGVDVLKLEFPISRALEADEKTQREACEALTNTIEVPWVLLSAGVDFDTYCQQVEIACSAGASGYMAGRAVWGEAARIQDTVQRLEWLEVTGRKRLSILAEKAGGGTAWMTKLSCQSVSTEWYATY